MKKLNPRHWGPILFGIVKVHEPKWVKSWDNHHRLFSWTVMSGSQTSIHDFDIDLLLKKQAKANIE